MKIAINRRYGGFSVSEAVYAELGLEWDGYGFIDHDPLIERHDPRLIAAIEKLGEKADGSLANIEIVEVPDGIEYEIEDYDGMEHVAEKHRTWR